MNYSGKITAILLALIFAFQFTICADSYEDIAASVAYSVEKSEITVSAVTEGNTVITVIPSDEKTDDINDDNIPVVIRVLTSYGRFSESIVMPDGISGGKYTVYITAPYGEDSADFVYINLDEANDTVEDINDAASSAEVEKLITENAIKIGIDSDDAVFKEHTSSFANMLYRKDYGDIIDFSNTYFEIYPLIALRGKSAKEAAEVIRQHESRLGINFEEDIEKEDRLSGEEKDILFIYMTEYDFESDYGKSTAPTFSQVLEAYKCVSAINGAENWVQLKKIITEKFKENYEEMLNSRKYKSLKDKDKVFELMMKHSYSAPSEIEERFEEAVATRYKKEEAPSGGSSGSSSGSSGGSSGGFAGSFTTSQNIPKPDFDAFKVTFNDISEDFWGFAAIDTLAADGIISGYGDGSFRPSNSITRAEFTKMIISVIKANKIEIAEGENAEFGDVKEDSWYFEYVNEAYRKGIIVGSDGLFLPQSNIKREDAALIIYRLMDKAGNTPSGIKAFPDRAEISDYAKSEVSALGSIGVVAGNSEGKFEPGKHITRAEAAQLIYNAFGK